MCAFHNLKFYFKSWLNNQNPTNEGISGKFVFVSCNIIAVRNHKMTINRDTWVVSESACSWFSHTVNDIIVVLINHVSLVLCNNECKGVQFGHQQKLNIDQLTVTLLQQYTLNDVHFQPLNERTTINVSINSTTVHSQLSTSTLYCLTVGQHCRHILPTIT